MLEIQLRVLELEDCERVSQIAAQCLPEHWSLSGIQDTLRYDNNFFYVACENENIVGFAGCMIIAEDAELLNIAVVPDYQKQGVGAKLLQEMLDVAKKQEAERILLEVREGNSVARQLYRSFGFKELGLRKHYYANPTEDAVIMERKL